MSNISNAPNNKDTVLYEKKEHIVVITINRPEVHNCIDPETSYKMAELWKQFNDDDAYVAIITGAGDKTFSTGADLKCGVLLLRVVKSVDLGKMHIMILDSED